MIQNPNFDYYVVNGQTGFIIAGFVNASDAERFVGTYAKTVQDVYKVVPRAYISHIYAQYADGYTPLHDWSRDEKNAIMCRLQVEGSGFAGALAEAYLRADSENRARIEREFHHLFEQWRPA